ncbi:hypothetical protein J6590_020318 [Homalodisca vitripennis]|nr:hypothetical protein J6590_020318 [Homalodisca vitripennis]
MSLSAYITITSLTGKAGLDIRYYHKYAPNSRKQEHCFVLMKLKFIVPITGRTYKTEVNRKGRINNLNLEAEDAAEATLSEANKMYYALNCVTPVSAFKDFWIGW